MIFAASDSQKNSDVGARLRTVLVPLGVLLSLYLFFALLNELLRVAPEPIGSRAALFFEGGKRSLLLTILSGGAGLFIGVFLGIAKLQRNVIFSIPSRVFIGIMRGTPLLVQILFVYYALPAIHPSLRFGEFTAAIIALAANVGAYNAESVRAGIMAIPKGQIEAARSLGLSRYKTMRWVVLPQALRIVTPPLVSNITALLKDSSLASSIGLLELTLAGNRVSSETFQPVPVLTTVALIYLALTTIFTGVAHFLERNMRGAR